MFRLSLWCTLLLIAILCTAGCIQSESPVSQPLPAPVVTPQTEPVHPAPSPVIPEPYIVKGKDIYGMTAALTSQEQGTNLLVTVTLDKTNTMGVTTGPGIEMYVTLFAYNLMDLPEGYLPQTQAEVRESGIPYKVRKATMYPMNVKKVTTELPVESSQGRLDLKYPYNYGAIIEKIY
ncbi:hypothetical protein [Methanocalculus sp.]|uniref:hypothetical protein n=1 Tax=Methanocalculus sp. TaxID=2004547 RepID=UPI00262C4B80|nr:hypothetical protein [Methanocalculus sp.]MDG6249546.1 hypothetical protein [Methanocalculus sp.]